MKLVSSYQEKHNSHKKGKGSLEKRPLKNPTKTNKNRQTAKKKKKKTTPIPSPTQHQPQSQIPLTTPKTQSFPSLLSLNPHLNANGKTCICLSQCSQLPFTPHSSSLPRKSSPSGVRMSYPPVTPCTCVPEAASACKTSSLHSRGEQRVSSAGQEVR